MSLEPSSDDVWPSLEAEMRRRDITLARTRFGAELTIRFGNSDFATALIAIDGFVIWHIQVDKAEDEFAERCPPLLNVINTLIPVGAFQIDGSGNIEFKFPMSYPGNVVSSDELENLLSWCAYNVDRFSKVIGACSADLVNIDDAIRKMRSELELPDSQDVNDEEAASTS